MQGFVHDDFVYKPGCIPVFYDHVDSSHKPALEQGKFVYRYAFVKGRHMSEVHEVNKVMAHMRERQWQFVDDVTDPTPYLEHVAGVAFANALHREPAVERALAHIRAHKWQRCKMVHGDLTFENVIIPTIGDFVFIDPGKTYGFMTPAVDRGKLLQSIVMRWEDRAWEEPNDLPHWAKASDVALLITHWVRLVPYWPELDTRSAFPILERLLTDAPR